MKKIRLLEFSNQWSMGGTEKTAQLFMKHIDKEQFEVFAAGWKGGDRAPLVEELGIELHIEPDPKKMTEWIKEKKIDIVHFHRMGDPDHKLIDTFSNAGIPIMVEHNIFAHVDSSADSIKINKHLFVSKVQKEIYKNRAGMYYEESKCESLYNPVETDNFDAYEFNRDFNIPVFGRYSRNHPEKWHPINVQILPYIKKALPDARFYIIGLPDEYREAIRNLGCEDMIVEFPNTISEKELCDFLNKITVFTHGSVWGESFGISIAEAMASGLPVVTHTGGDSAQTELVTDEYNGYVVDQKDVEGYANRVIELLKNPELKRSMGERGRERVHDWFNVKDLVKNLEGILIELYEEYAKVEQ